MHQHEQAPGLRQPRVGELGRVGNISAAAWFGGLREAAPQDGVHAVLGAMKAKDWLSDERLTGKRYADRKVSVPAARSSGRSR